VKRFFTNPNHNSDPSNCMKNLKVMHARKPGGN